MPPFRKWGTSDEEGCKADDDDEAFENACI